jgi:chromosome segregation ATPase
LKSKLEEKGEKVEINLEYTTHEKISAEKKVSEATAENETLKKQLKDTQDQLTKKVNETAPFLNMKKMLVKKNAEIKHIREQLVKLDPKQFADDVNEEE